MGLVGLFTIGPVLVLPMQELLSVQVSASISIAQTSRISRPPHTAHFNPLTSSCAFQLLFTELVDVFVNSRTCSLAMTPPSCTLSP